MATGSRWCEFIMSARSRYPAFSSAKVHQKSELRKVLQINMLRKIYFLIRLD